MVYVRNDPGAEYEDGGDTHQVRLERFLKFEMEGVVDGMADPAADAPVKSEPFKEAEGYAPVAYRKKVQNHHSGGPDDRLRIGLNTPHPFGKAMVTR